MDAPSAGWYADPQDPSVQRFWDGETWTAATAPRSSNLPAVAGHALPALPIESRVSPTTMIASDQRSVPIQTVIAWIIAVLTLGYMLPWAIAATRGKSNSLAIGLLNFFVGWTVIGWIASLVMACMAHQKFAVSG